MVMKNFEYFAPTTLEQASSLLTQYGDDAKALAGGQSLIPIMKLNLTEIKYLVDLKRIPGLSFVNMESPDSSGQPWLSVGALTTHSDVASNELVLEHAPLLAAAAKSIGHTQIRNRGTIGGSLCHSDASADLVPTSLVLEMEMVVTSKENSTRIIPARDFFLGTFTTALKKGELLERVRVPSMGPNTTFSFKKLTMGHGSFPLVVVSVLLHFVDDRCVKAAIGLGGVAEKGFRVEDAEKTLTKAGRIRGVDIIEAARISEEAAKPESDLDASAAYKKRMVGVLVKRALTDAAHGKIEVKEV